MWKEDGEHNFIFDQKYKNCFKLFKICFRHEQLLTTNGLYQDMWRQQLENLKEKPELTSSSSDNELVNLDDSKVTQPSTGHGQGHGNY